MLSFLKRCSAFVPLVALATLAFMPGVVHPASFGQFGSPGQPASGRQTETTESPSPGTATMGPSFNNGRNLYKVNFANGAFVNVAPGKWEETDAQGKGRFTFAEVSRAFESVALHDAGRNIYITLDLMKKQVLIRTGTGPTSALYTITSMVYPTPHITQAGAAGTSQPAVTAYQAAIPAGAASKPATSTPAPVAAAQASGSTAGTARYRLNTPTGYFETTIQTLTPAFGASPYVDWTEHASDGRVIARFVGKPSPVGFTLFDPSRSMRVSLNLLEKEARVSTRGGPVGLLAKIESFGVMQGGKFASVLDLGSSPLYSRGTVRGRIETESDTFRREGDRKWVQVRKSSPGVTFRTYVEANNSLLLRYGSTAIFAGLVGGSGAPADAAGERGFVLLYDEAADLSLLLDLDTKVMTNSAMLKAQPILQGE